MRYELTDYEWTSIKPFLPKKPRGAVLQQDQAMSACRNALRQARGELPSLHPTRINPAMAAS
jgi:transposase